MIVAWDWNKSLTPLYQDEHILALSKPEGIPIQKTLDSKRKYFFEDVKKQFPTASLIHRLDAPVSGITLFGLTKVGNQWLTETFKLHELIKLYVFRRNDSTKELPWTRHQAFIDEKAGPGGRMAFIPKGNNGKISITWYCFLSKNLGCAHIETGRRHQIRLTMATLEESILGDTLYGGNPHQRLHLHAATVICRPPWLNTLLKIEDRANFLNETEWKSCLNQLPGLISILEKSKKFLS